MTEILTESFCERCGTRYTFESAAPRRSRIGRVRTVSRGLRNFVLSDESTLSEAMADARSDEERSATTSQLDAFHKTFNFCLTCRQYTCGNCWNTAEGRCLTCVPLPGMDKDAQLLVVPAIAFEPNGNGAHVHDGLGPEPGLEGWPEIELGPEAWPDADVGVDRVGGAVGAAAIAADDEAEAGSDADAAPAVDAEAMELEEWPTTAEFDAAEAEAVAQAAGEADDELVMLDDAAVEARINGVAPGQSLEDAVAAYEAQLAAEEAQERHAALAAAAMLAAVDAGPEPEVVAEPELMADEAIPEVVAFEAIPEPVAFEAAVVVPEAVVAEPEAVAAEPEAAAWMPEPEPEIAAAAEVAAEPEPDHAALAAAALLAVAAEPETAAIEPEAATAAEPEAQPVPEPVAAAEPEPDHAGLAAAALLAAAAEQAAAEQAAAPAAREDVVAQPTWPVAPAPVEPAAVPPVQPAPAPEPVQPAPNPWLTVAPDDGSAEPQWPVTPAWAQPAVSRNGQPATLAGRPLVPQDNAASLWAASAREVLTGGARVPEPTAAPQLTPQPCVSCGLSLSANARFCRRCGSRQG